jgi:hypothetical protein
VLVELQLFQIVLLTARKAATQVFLLLLRPEAVGVAAAQGLALVVALAVVVQQAQTPTGMVPRELLDKVIVVVLGLRIITVVEVAVGVAHPLRELLEVLAEEMVEMELRLLFLVHR